VSESLYANFRELSRRLSGESPERTGKLPVPPLPHTAKLSMPSGTGTMAGWTFEPRPSQAGHHKPDSRSLPVAEHRRQGSTWNFWTGLRAFCRRRFGDTERILHGKIAQKMQVVVVAGCRF